VQDGEQKEWDGHSILTFVIVEIDVNIIGYYQGFIIRTQLEGINLFSIMYFLEDSSSKESG